MLKSIRFQNFDSFYPYYLTEHSDRTNRRLHFVGTTLAMILFAVGVLFRNVRALMLTPIAGYGFAWAGHFFFEKNKPATFEYPLFSFMGDIKMWKDIFMGKLKF